MVPGATSRQPVPNFLYFKRNGKPVANNTKQFHWIVQLYQNLDWMYADHLDVLVAGNLFWYPVEERPDIATSPDIMVVFGRPKGDRGFYLQWREDQVPPQVVFEVFSACNSQAEQSRKLLFYDRFGVQEYYAYHPETNDLYGWCRRENKLEAIEPIANWVSPQLGIRFDLSGGTLRIFRPDGDPFASYAEVNQRLQQERSRAQLAEKRLSQLEAMLQQYRKKFGELP